VRTHILRLVRYTLTRGRALVPSFGAGAALVIALPLVAARSQSIAVTPDGASTSVAGSSMQTYTFTVQNTGATSMGVDLKTICPAPLSSCETPNPSTIALAAGALVSVAIAYRAGAAGTTGVLKLVATRSAFGTPTDTGSVSVSATAAPSAGYLAVDTTIHNYSNHGVELCEAQCFTPRFELSTVPFIAGDRPQSITVAYNADAVATRPILSVDAALGAGAPTLQEYWLEARDSTGSAITFVNGDTKLRFAPPSTQTAKVRLSGQFNAAAYPTGVYPVTVVVTAKYAAGRDSSVIPTRFLVINARKDYGPASLPNRNAAALARGWYITSYSRLYKLGADALVVDGNNSATFFLGCGTSCWAAPAGDFTRMSRGPADGFVREFPDSSREEYAAEGFLLRRISRTQDTVTFTLSNIYTLGEQSNPFRRNASGNGMPMKINRSGAVTGWGAILEFDDAFSNDDGRLSPFNVSTTDSSLIEWRDPDRTYPNGVATKLLYDASGRLSKVVNRLGDTTTFTYNATTWKLASVVSPRFTVDPRLYGSGQTRQLTTTYTPWQTASVPTTSTASTLWAPALADTIRGIVTDPGGHVTAFTPDRWGQAVVTTELPGSALARTTIAYRSAFSSLVDSVRHHEGGLDEFRYSGPLLTYQKAAGQNAVNTAYTKFAQPDSVWGTGIPKQVFTLGSRGRVDVAMTVAGTDTFKTRYAYDSRFRVDSVIDPGGHVTKFRYHAVHGNLDSTRTPGGRGTKTLFDLFGRDTASRAGTLPWRKTVYDSVNRALKRITAASVNPDTTIVSDDSLNLKQVRDAEGNTYDFAHNALGLITQRTDPAGNADKYFYNDEGLLTSWVNRRGDTLKTTYDDLHRRLSKSGQVAVTDSFSYAASGRSMAAWNVNSRDSVFTDSSGWTDSVVTRLATDPAKRFRMQYRKTAVGQLDSIDVASNTPIAFAGRKYVWNSTKGTLDEIRLNGQSASMGYNSELLRSSVSLPGSVTRNESTLSIHNQYRADYNTPAVDTLLWRSTAFDSVGRVSEYYAYALSNKDRTKYVYKYDEQGRLKKWIDSTLFYQNPCSDTPNADFGSRLCTGYTGIENGLDTLSYDRVGNITYSHGNAGTGSATYDKNRITSWPGYTFGRDSAGNVTRRTPNGGNPTDFYWSADGMLDSVIAGTRKIQYDYNAFGQLVRKRVNGSPDRHFLWDQGHLLAELDASDTLRLSEYAYQPGTDRPLAVMTGATSIATTIYLQRDPLGNVIGGVTSGGSVDGASVVAEPWGIYEATLPGVATSNTNRLRLKGMFLERDSTQLYYVRARWYDPLTHRFMTPDPIGLTGGINPFAAFGNDPVNSRDPSGTLVDDSRGVCTLFAASCGGISWEWGGSEYSQSRAGTQPGLKITCKTDLPSCLEILNRALLTLILTTAGPGSDGRRANLAEFNKGDQFSIAGITFGFAQRTVLRGFIEDNADVTLQLFGGVRVGGLVPVFEPLVQNAVLNLPLGAVSGYGSLGYIFPLSFSGNLQDVIRVRIAGVSLKAIRPLDFF
jgi:RHS repeat-associated protein